MLLGEPTINRRGFARPALTCLQFAHVTMIIRNGFQIWGSCQFLTVNGRSVSKSMCSRRNKGDWCENHGDNFSHFCRRPLQPEEEEEEET